MKRIIAIWVPIIAITLISVSYYIPRLFSAKTALTVLLRCDEQVSGILLLSFVQQDITHNFDVKSVCNKGEIILSDYKVEQSIKTIFKYKAEEEIELISTYGLNIQAGPSDYYLILDLTDTYPFIANGNI